MFENDTNLQLSPREFNIQCINNDFHREQIQTPPMLTEKEARSLASTEEDKSLSTKYSGKITEDILPSFFPPNS